MKKLLAMSVVATLLISVVIWLPQSETCPFVPVPPGKLSGRLEGRTVQSSADPLAFVFRSKLERNDDGGPDAYHIGFNGIGPDPGHTSAMEVRCSNTRMAVLSTSIG